MTTPKSALAGDRYPAPSYHRSGLSGPLAAASEVLRGIAEGRGLSRDQWNTVAAAYLAAEALYDLAERVAHGEPTDPLRCSRWMDMALRLAGVRLAELHWRYGVQVVPEAVDWRGHDWPGDAFGAEGCGESGGNSYAPPSRSQAD